jgi:hypothetical protein
MSSSAELLTDAFGRIRGIVRSVVNGLGPDALTYRVDPRANTIVWLVWHLTRIQDDHIAEVAGQEQVWIAQGFADRFALPFEIHDTGYGHSADDVGAVRVDSGELLVEYHEAVYEQTVRYVRTITDDDLDRVVDRAWDPPVTLGVRLVSVLSDDLQHAGQAAFVRGLVERR